MQGFHPIKAPQGPAALISAEQTIHGPPILPIARIKLYSSGEWEEFIHEWADCSLKGEVVRFSQRRSMESPLASSISPR